MMQRWLKKGLVLALALAAVVVVATLVAVRTEAYPTKSACSGCHPLDPNTSITVSVVGETDTDITYSVTGSDNYNSEEGWAVFDSGGTNTAHGYNAGTFTLPKDGNTYRVYWVDDADSDPTAPDPGKGGSAYQDITTPLPPTPTPSPTPTPTATPTPTPTPSPTPTPTPAPLTCEEANPVITITTIAKGQSPSNNPKVWQDITGHIVGGAAAYGPTAHRIKICEGTSVSVAIYDATTTGVGPVVTPLTAGISCTSGAGATCSVGSLTATEKYKAVSEDGKDTDRVALIPQS